MVLKSTKKGRETERGKNSCKRAQNKKRMILQKIDKMTDKTVEKVKMSRNKLTDESQKERLENFFQLSFFPKRLFRKAS